MTTTRPKPTLCEGHQGRPARLTSTRTTRLLEGKGDVVGPAETLLGTGRGRVIDSFGLVVRFNTAIEYMPFAGELARDVGSRTDILYCNNEVLGDRIVREQGLTRERFVRACAEIGIKYFVGVNNDYVPGETDGRLPKGQAQLEEFRKFPTTQAERALPVLFLHARGRARLAGRLHRRTGFLGIVDLLRYDLRRLHITGMTFYHKGGHLFSKIASPSLTR